jgi:hypothetical protein
MQVVPLELYPILGSYLDIVSASRLSQTNKDWLQWWQHQQTENEDYQNAIHFLDFARRIQVLPVVMLTKLDNPQLTYWYLTKHDLLKKCEATEVLKEGYIAEGCSRSLQALLTWTQEEVSWVDLEPAAENGHFDFLLHYCRKWGYPHEGIWRALVQHTVDDLMAFLYHLQPQEVHLKTMRLSAAESAPLSMYIWLCQNVSPNSDVDNDLDLALLQENMPVVEYCHSLGMISQHPRKTLKQCIAAGHDGSVIFMILQGWNLEGSTLMAMRHHQFHILEILHTLGGQTYTSQLLTLALAQKSVDALQWCIEHNIAFSTKHFHMLFQHDFVQGVQYLYECGVIMPSKDWCKHILTWNAKKIAAWVHDIQ